MRELRTRKRGKNWEWSFEMAKVNGELMTPDSFNIVLELFTTN